MLKKLRLRIIVTIMAMATFVFVVAFFILCSTIWYTSSSAFTHELEEAVANGPTVSVDFSIGGWNPRFDAVGDEGSDDGSSTDDEGSRKRSPHGSFTPIALITFDPDEGTVVQYNADYAAMSQAVRATAIERTLEKANGSGIYTDLGLFWCIHSNKDGELVLAFADAGAFLSSMRATVMGILAVFALTLVAVTFVSILLAHLITRPVKRAWDQQTQFIASASHELRSPLAVILSSIRAMQDAPPAEAARFRDTIQSEGERMSRLVGDMLSLANADNQSWSIHPAPCELDTLLLEISEKYEPLMRSKKLSLSVELPDEELPPCICDPSRMGQVLGILLDNSLAYVPAGGKIRLSLSCREAQFLLTVSDNGPGIPDEKKEAVFQRFYRADAARKDKQHFGLGLCIAKEIVLLHKGEIQVQDAPGGGAEFVITLPL